MTVNTLASTSAASLAYLEETVYGVVPGSGTPKFLRNIGEDMSLDFTTAVSAEINKTRQAPDSIVTDAAASGGIKIELSYHEYDPFLEALLSSTFASYGTNGVRTLTGVNLTRVDNTGDTLALTGIGTDLVAGQWLVIGSTGNALWSTPVACLLKTVAADLITLDPSTRIPSEGDGTDDIWISSSRMSNGVAGLRSFSIEKNFSDTANMFFVHTGRVPSKLDLDFRTGSILTGTIGFLGATAQRNNATAFPNSPSASQAYGVMNAVTGVGKLLIRKHADGSDALGGAYVQSMQISIDAALRGQKAIGTLGNVGIGVGTFKMSGKMEIYLASGTIFDEALAQRAVSVSFPVQDALGNGYAFTFDHIKMKPPKIVAGSKDQDVIMSVDFEAIAPDTTNDRMLHIDRFGVAVS